jgi:hypothetical protein
LWLRQSLHRNSYFTRQKCHLPANTLIAIDSGAEGGL